KTTGFEIFAVAAASFNPASMRSRSCSRSRPSFYHATSQNPQDSRINCVMIQDGKLRGFAMGQAIAVRTDYTAGEVRRFAQRAKDAAQARRLLAIAAVLDGASREEAAKIGCMDRQTLRYWVIRFNEQGADGLINLVLDAGSFLVSEHVQNLSKIGLNP